MGLETMRQDETTSPACVGLSLALPPGGACTYELCDRSLQEGGCRWQGWASRRCVELLQDLRVVSNITRLILNLLIKINLCQFVVDFGLKHFI